MTSREGWRDIIQTTIYHRKGGGFHYRAGAEEAAINAALANAGREAQVEAVMAALREYEFREAA